MRQATKKTHFPRTRLGDLVARSGGISRAAAITAAQANIENLRDLALDAIECTVREIENSAYAAADNRLDNACMKSILDKADRLVTMTAMFNLDTLEGVTKSLCDVTASLIAQHSEDAAPIIVHAQAMRFMAPGSTNMDAEQSRQILANLDKVRARYSAP